MNSASKKSVFFSDLLQELNKHSMIVALQAGHWGSAALSLYFKYNSNFLSTNEKMAKM